MPKAFDIFSFAALAVSGIVSDPKAPARVLSFNDILASHSAIDTYMSDLITTRSEPLHLKPEFSISISASEPTTAPAEKKRNLFYIGVNWELVYGGAVRSKSLLKKLDASGELTIYGPPVVRGIRVWEGYQSYAGSLPFDGQAVVSEIAKHGAALVLSHPGDIKTGLATGRIYEAAAAGAVIISDQNRAVREWFGDAVLYFENDSPTAFEQIMAHLDWMNTHQAQAAEMAREAQEIFRKEFSLDVALKRIYATLPERKKQLQFGLDPASDDNPQIRLYYILSDDSEQSVDFCLRSCCDQDYCNMDVVVIVDGARETGKLEKALRESSVSYDLRCVKNLQSIAGEAVGQLIAPMLARDRNANFEYFNVAVSGEWLYSDHLSSLMRIQRIQAGSVVASVSEVARGDIREVQGADLKGAYEVRKSNSIEEEMDKPCGFGKFLLPKSAITDLALKLLPSLGRRAMLALVGDQPIKTSFLATVLVDRTLAFFDKDDERNVENKLLGTWYENAALQLVDPVLEDRSLLRDKRRRRKRQKKLNVLIFILAGALAASLSLLY